MELKPYLNDTIEADLPENRAITSDFKISVGNACAVERNRSGNDITHAICELSTSGMCEVLANQKLHFIEKEDMQQEEEHYCNRHMFVFEEWEKLQANIRALRQDLYDNCLDNATRIELEDDIKTLVQRKKQLAVELGFTYKNWNPPKCRLLKFIQFSYKIINWT